MPAKPKTITDIITRRQRSEFGYGVATADSYVQQVVKSVGTQALTRYAGNGEFDVDEILNESAKRLVICQENHDDDVTTGIEQMKAILPSDVELPKHTLMLLRHKLTTPRVDRDGDVLFTEGAQVDPKMPMLWQHMHTFPIGKRITTLLQNSKVLRLASVLLDLNELTSDAAKLIEAGVLRFSHGFIPIEWEERLDKDGNWLGFNIMKFEVMEASLVSVPSNVDAEIELFSRDKLASDIFKAHAKSLFDARQKMSPGIDLTKEEANEKPDAEEEKAVELVDDDPTEKETPEPEVKSGREISKANLKRLIAIHDDLAELAEDEDMKRGSKALVVRSRDALKELIERVAGDEDDDDSKQTAPLPPPLPVSLDPKDAAATLLACTDAELKTRVWKALSGQQVTAALDKRGAEFRRLIS